MPLIERDLLAAPAPRRWDMSSASGASLAWVPLTVRVSVEAEVFISSRILGTFSVVRSSSA